MAVMREAGSSPDGVRLRAPIVILWRAGVRIGEALALAETDLDAARGAVLVRRGKGGRRREVGRDRWAWSQRGPSRTAYLRAATGDRASGEACHASGLGARPEIGKGAAR